ncbi:MAG TPA: response regulator transcription factor [Candidatus Ozemobacteraceae bacterium]
MIRVFIIDDHPIVRKGIRETVTDAADMSVVGEAATGEQGIAWLGENACDVVILDLSLPGLPGLEVLSRVKSLAKSLPVLIMTMHAEKIYAARAFKLGASGFIPKDSPPEVIIEALRKVASGGKFVTPDMAEKMLFEREENGKKPHEVLSNREFLILKMIGTGDSPQKIGELLSISVKTVSTYRARILQKLGLKTNAELVRYCIQNQLDSD